MLHINNFFNKFIAYLLLFIFIILRIEQRTKDYNNKIHILHINYFFCAILNDNNKINKNKNTFLVDVPSINSITIKIGRMKANFLYFLTNIQIKPDTKILEILILISEQSTEEQAKNK